MRLYSICTPSHRPLLTRWFLPTLPDDLELVLEAHPQECPTGEFMRDGWLRSMRRKVDVVLRGIHENWGELFVHADVDCQFFDAIEGTLCALLEDNDMLIQRNDPKGGLCAGFFACRANDRTLELWNLIRRDLAGGGRNDQVLLNQRLRRRGCAVKWAYLPHTFFGGGTLAGRLWEPGMTLEVPDGIQVHHANWTIGVTRKHQQLEYVRNVVCHTPAGGMTEAPLAGGRLGAPSRSIRARTC